jgi:hypothetical protein
MHYFWSSWIGVGIAAEIWSILTGRMTLTQVIQRLSKSPQAQVALGLVLAWFSYHALWDREDTWLKLR